MTDETKWGCTAWGLYLFLLGGFFSLLKMAFHTLDTGQGLVPVLLAFLLAAVAGSWGLLVLRTVVADHDELRWYRSQEEERRRDRES